MANEVPTMRRAWNSPNFPVSGIRNPKFLAAPLEQQIHSLFFDLFEPEALGKHPCGIKLLDMDAQLLAGRLRFFL